MSDTPPASPSWWFVRASLMALILVCLPLAGFLFAYGLVSTWQRDTEPQVLALLHRQQDAWNAGDLEEFMTGYWDSDELTFFSGGDVRRGYAPLLERYRKRYQSGGNAMGKLTFSELVVTPMGRNGALARGRWKVVTTKGTFDGLFTLSLSRFDDEWKITHDHTSQTEPVKK